MIAVECRTGDLFNGLVPGCQFFESNKLYLLFCEKCACNLSKPQKVSKIPLAERIVNFANPPFSFFFLRCLGSLLRTEEDNLSFYIEGLWELVGYVMYICHLYALFT
jgi:hypothetical protein